MGDPDVEGMSECSAFLHVNALVCGVLQVATENAELHFGQPAQCIHANAGASDGCGQPPGRNEYVPRDIEAVHDVLVIWLPRRPDLVLVIPATKSDQRPLRALVDDVPPQRTSETSVLNVLNDAAVVTRNCGATLPIIVPCRDPAMTLP
ncbi:hypothetical protein KC19_VG043000 [Ceratodon purpureus]|uniref:Uncharacterized protein n=1 Tax=Ceratodon purpureus TaxID=3225 RepID=A0A8T0HM47_CERPU|nr:hypothetical protein KC19_VG043000 [Ceratodon purpureus]